jgi:acyl dehydratase
VGVVLVNIGNRRFTYFNQSEFAQFSGDFNPIHLDQIEARKSIAGQPIVHGHHSFLWMLECLIQREERVFTNYDIRFANQLNLEQEVSAFWDRESKKLKLVGKNDLIHVSVRCEDPTSCDVFANNISPVTLSNTITQPIDLDLSAVSVGDTFENLCGGKKELAASLFPYLTEALGEDVVYEIALLSSIGGMIVPGLHSLLFGLKITFKDGADNQIVTVNSKQELFRLIKLDYVGINLDATIEAFFRPKSVTIPSCEDLSNQLPPALSMTGKKVLIIGGSRGLGAWVAKLVGISGGNVTITFNTGKDDAELVAQDIRC